MNWRTVILTLMSAPLSMGHLTDADKKFLGDMLPQAMLNRMTGVYETWIKAIAIKNLEYLRGRGIDVGALDVEILVTQCAEIDDGK
jgi:hypothetical protein